MSENYQHVYKIIREDCKKKIEFQFENCMPCKEAPVVTATKGSLISQDEKRHVR